MTSHFATLPATARSNPTPFNVSISSEKLEELHQLLTLSKIGPQTFETDQSDGRFGITRDWLVQAKTEWERFEWKHVEKEINHFPNFKIAIHENSDSFDIHFVGLFSQREDAIPILLLHGWPGSFMEFLPIMRILSRKYRPETLPYHIIVPSLPGFAFSSPPPFTRDFRIENVADIMNSLMIELGFESGYAVQGGDIGSKVGRVMAATYSTVKALHINFCIMPHPEGVEDSALTPNEKQGIQRAADFHRLGSAYALMHATKPSTIGLALAANPLSLLAWIGEKFLAWTDNDPPLGEILASVTLYWLTETFPRSIYPYRQLFTPGVIGAHENPKWHLKIPFGFSFFPKEIAPTPKAWVATSGDLVFYREHRYGGHFAALERPETLLKDVQDYLQQVWKL